jgi:hypothetical protein
MPHLKIKLLLIGLVLLLLFLLVSGCAKTLDLNDQIREAVGDFRFRLFDWEVKTLSAELVGMFEKNKNTAGNSTLDGKLLESRIREAFAAQGIYNPLDRFLTLKVGFPPVNIYLGDLPHVLVISPRDRIENIREANLLPEMAVKDIESIEAKMDALGYSSLVEGLGGLSTFPSYITANADTHFIIDTAAHEWLHLYLTFTPLGFVKLLDVLGIRHDYDVSTMNETVADIVSREIGDIVYHKFYAPLATDNAAPESPSEGFDFSAAMREIRLSVDAYLAKGEIEKAEQFMVEKRRYLEDNGYYIRKLNQAYFAFHGTYADSPASVSPIGRELKDLRGRSSSLKDFLDRVAAMSSRQDLIDSLQ